MPRYKVRLEYALAFDIDLEIDARDRRAAVNVGLIATEDAAVWDAIRGQFAGYRAEYASGDMEVTDVRVERTVRRLRGAPA